MNLKELSQELGLSQTTVSRALNGYPEVNEATRRRIFEAAEQHNYRPSSRAKALATGRSMAIGHVIPISTNHEMVNPIFADFIAGAGETYSANGYDIMLSVISDDDEARVYREMAARGTVEGVIVHAPRDNDPRIKLLREIGMPFVVHGRASNNEDSYSWVDVNNRRAFQRATEFLADLGHSRIGLINGLEGMDFARRRRAGYERALQDRGITPDPAIMRSDEMTEVYGHNSAHDMLGSKAPPTAFVVSSMITAIGVRRACADLGLQLGKDVSVITHDDDLSYFRNGGEVPFFTALRSSVREAGRRSATMLLDRIRQPETPASHELMEVEFVIGHSTGPAPAMRSLLESG